jgi:hypothetical protein
LVLAGIISGDLLLQLAARVGLQNHMAGLACLTLVALSELVVTVAMFQVLRPGLPRVRAALEAAEAQGGAVWPRRGTSRLAHMITIALLPFFAYYAAWGFLGDTVRQYSRLALDLAPFGESGNVLDALDSRWLLVSVAVSWAVRHVAKRLQARSASSLWQIVVVICETNWIFVGLYVISRWKDTALDWLMSRSFWSVLQALADEIAAPVAVAVAKPMVPVEISSVTPAAITVNLFFFMLLPLVWLVMTALIYGYDVRDERELMRVHRRVERFGERYRAVPKFFRDFVEHFIQGYRSRYLPIANGVRLTANSSLLLLVTLIVGYRLIDWSAAWLWLGAARLIGAHDIDSWQVIAHGLTLLFGSPYQDSSTGILVEPLRISFLAAVLETAFALPRRAGAAVQVAA